MSEGGSVAGHINEFNMITSQLSSVDINFEDKIEALILMSSLSESWDTVVAAISSSRGSDKLKFDEIRDVVLSKSIRKRKIEDSSGSALSVDRRGRSKSKSPTMGDQNQGTEENLQTNQTLSVGVVEKKVTFGQILQRGSRITNQKMTTIR